MLRKFFNGNRNSASTPGGKLIYAIGDIHGCAKELDELLIMIDEEVGDIKDAQLIFLGDYVDRGPDSKGVLDRLIALKKNRGETIFLKGNHEAVMLDFLSNPEDMYHWLDWGGEETLHSYGIDPVLGRAPEELAAELREKMPAGHETFLKELTLKHIEGDYLFVHAGVRPGVPLEEQQEEDLLWIRKRFHNAGSNERPEYVVVHGHQPLDKPLDAGWRIAVDTGACWTGKLTAVVLEDDTRHFISTKR